MSVPYARPSLEYGYTARVDPRDYDSRPRRTYRPTRTRGGPPAQKQAVCSYFFSYIHVFFCTECLVILHALRVIARVIGVVIVVKLVKRSLHREATEIMNFFFFLLFIFFLTDAKPKTKK